jgi:hypothetical protein
MDEEQILGTSAPPAVETYPGVEQEQTLDTPAPSAETTDVEVEKQTPYTPAPSAETTDVEVEKQIPDTSSAVEAQSDSVKRSASPKRDARGVSMKVDNDSNYIKLYNEAINKIFKYYNDAIFTLYQDPRYFRTLDSPSLSYHDLLNPKHFKSPNSLSKSATDTCREQFLSFMSDNFQNFNNMDLVKGIHFLDIVEKVRQFIKKMDVKMTNNNIVVTLHDIKTKYSPYDTDHCISERLFMAILLAIQMLHCPTPSPDRQYTLKFKFASNLFITSSLQKSSMKCTNNSGMSNLKSNDDPVAANIFDFDLRYLKPKPQSEQLKTGGSKSRRRHRRHHKSKHVRKTRRGRGRKSKPKPKTHRRRSARHSRIRKHKKYTRKR